VAVVKVESVIVVVVAVLTVVETTLVTMLYGQTMVRVFEGVLTKLRE
jgi:hypothetical protein